MNTRMNESSDVVPIGTLAGKAILSLGSGNKLGRVLDVLVDPVNGLLLGLDLEHEGGISELPYEKIYSIGKDAVMAVSDDSVVAETKDEERRIRRARDLLGTQVVMESGEILGEIADVFVTLKPPPAVLYEVRRSMLDRLLGRTFFIPASVGNVLSADAKRLLVPDITAEIATDEISTLIGPSVDVRSFPVPQNLTAEFDDAESAIIERDEDATVLRFRDREDDTLLVRDDEDETVLRPLPSSD